MTMNNKKDKEKHEKHVVRSENCCHTIAKSTIAIITSWQLTQEKNSTQVCHE
jgi:uncharacterized protein YbdZ (MbtH family)